MKFLYLTLLLLTATHSLHTMERPECNTVVCRIAMMSDITELLTLLDHCSTEDMKKIVVLPPCIREQAIKNAIQAGRIFVAVKSGHIVGFKKLYIVNKKDELKTILEEELRCIDACGCYKAPESSGILSNQLTLTTFLAHELPSLNTSVFIYNGNDFTHPVERRRGINTLLTGYALRHQLIALRSQLGTSFFSICLVYGLVDSGQDLEGGRTAGIASIFRHELQALNLEEDDSLPSLLCARFPAIKPEFNETGNPLADSLSTPGFGYILSYSLGA